MANDNNLQPAGRRKTVVLGLSAVILEAIIVFAIVAFTPVKRLIPGYPSASEKLQAERNAERLDSLENEILQWRLYAENLRRVVAGEDPLKLDSPVRQEEENDNPVGPDSKVDTLVKSRLRELEEAGR